MWNTANPSEEELMAVALILARQACDLLGLTYEDFLEAGKLEYGGLPHPNEFISFRALKAGVEYTYGADNIPENGYQVLWRFADLLEKGENFEIQGIDLDKVNKYQNAMMREDYHEKH